MTTLVLLGFTITACIVVAALNAYQAVTGRRLSSTPSQRDDRTMRRESSIAAILLGLFAALGLAVLTFDLCLPCSLGG